MVKMGTTLFKVQLSCLKRIVCFKKQSSLHLAFPWTRHWLLQEEFRKGLESQDSSTHALAQQVQAKWDTWDKNGDGEISLKELRTALAKEGKKVDNEELQFLFEVGLQLHNIYI
jgi:hypothetical protein